MSLTQTAPPRTVHVPQNVDTEVSFVAVPGANLRYAYFRSADSVASQIEGQDYLSFKYDGRRLTFVVCDGVGSSFCGNIAARVLGEEMLEWLWALDAGRLSSAEALSETARSYLHKLQPKVAREVARYQLPDSVSPLVQQALEAQRAYGSETVFVAGRVDQPGDASEGRTLLVWMGDTQVQLYDDGGGALDIDASFDANDRWSSAQGVRGRVHSWVTDVPDTARLLVFSDGIAGHAAHLPTYSDRELEEAIQTQFRTATSDDVALLDVVLHTPAFMGLAGGTQPVDASLGAPRLALIEKDRRDATYELNWEWDGGRARFEVQEAANPAFHAAYTEQISKGTSWRTEEPRSPGRYYYRVRALTGRKPSAGPWSDTQVARVAYPPPDAPQFQPIGSAPVEGAFAVTWNEVANAQEYVLEEATRDDFSDAAPVYRGRGTEWHTGASRQPKRYVYRVQAVNDGGASAWSAPQTVAVIVPPPPVPTLAYIREVPPATPVPLTWSEVAKAAYYEVEELDEATDERQTFETEGSRLAIEPRPAGRYTYRVRACHDHACSEWSASQTAVVLPDAPDDAPELQLDGPDENGQLQVAWSPVERATRYVLEEADSPDFKRARPMAVGERGGHSLLRREPGLYYYRVRAENVSGFGPWSEPASTHVRPGTPAWVEVNVPDGGKPQVEVAWERVAGQVGYVLELFTGDPGAPPEAHDWTDAKEAYKGREPAAALRVSKDVRAFAFRVRATHTDGDGEWAYGEWVVRAGPPLPPRLETPVFQPDGNVLVRWEPVAEATHYEIEYARDDAFDDARRKTTDRIRFIYQPSSGEEVWFRVRAHNEHGPGDPGPPVLVAVQRVAAPDLLSVAPQPPHTLFKVTWTAVEGAKHYELQEAPDADFQSVERHLVDAPAREWSVQGREPGRVHLRVQAVGADGRASAWSGVVVVEVGDG